MADDETAMRLAAERGERAKALLADDLLTAAFDKLKAEYASAWVNTAPGDTTLREKLYLAMKTLPAVRHNLETMVNDGKIAAHQLAHIDAEKKRKPKPGVLAWHSTSTSA